MDKRAKWFVKQLDSSTWYAENRRLGEQTITGAHCGACARLELIQKYGGWVDTRGMHIYGLCADWLVIANRENKRRALVLG